MQTREGKPDNSMRNHGSVPMLRSSYRARAGQIPWLPIDPNLAADCTSAVRAMRLVLLALFALFTAPMKSRPSVSGKGTDVAKPELKSSPGHSFERLKAGIGIKHVTMQKVGAVYSTSADASCKGEHLRGRTQTAVNDPKRESMHLRIKRDHAPPPTKPTCFHAMQSWLPPHPRTFHLTPAPVLTSDRLTPSPIHFRHFLSLSNTNPCHTDALRARLGNLCDSLNPCCITFQIARNGLRATENTFAKGEHL